MNSFCECMWPTIHSVLFLLDKVCSIKRKSTGAADATDGTTPTEGATPEKKAKLDETAEAESNGEAEVAA